MNKPERAVGLWLALAGITGSTVFVQAAEQTKKILQKGVYTRPQAKSGKAIYHEKCSSCHLDNLAGGTNESPALKGHDFLSHWNGRPLRALYSRIVSTMPINDPGTLSEKETLDVLAYILQVNGFPAGEKAPKSADDLSKIQFPKGK
jgi:mono/diheme cytochrome c family protein